jgi:hypothetical protein
MQRLFCSCLVKEQTLVKNDPHLFPRPLAKEGKGMRFETPPEHFPNLLPTKQPHANHMQKKAAPLEALLF